MSDKILLAQCRHCGKTIVSMYEGQLKFNHAQHEKWCRMNKTKGEAQSEKGPRPSKS